MPTVDREVPQMQRLLFAAMAVLPLGALVVGYGIGHARASGVPTVGTGTLTYTGSLLTFGQPDNNLHQIAVALWPSGATSAACTTGTQSVQATNGEFSVPLPPACVGVRVPLETWNEEMEPSAAPLPAYRNVQAGFMALGWKDDAMADAAWKKWVLTAKK